MRLIAGHATGGADLEWFSIQPNGTRILLNDLSNTNALLAFRARNHGPPPLLNKPVVSLGNISLFWSGTGLLEEATSVNGPWYTSVLQDNPQTFTAGGQAKLYRVRHF